VSYLLHFDYSAASQASSSSSQIPLLHNIAKTRFLRSHVLITRINNRTIFWTALLTVIIRVFYNTIVHMYKNYCTYVATKEDRKRRTKSHHITVMTRKSYKLAQRKNYIQIRHVQKIMYMYNTYHKSIVESTYCINLLYRLII